MDVKCLWLTDASGNQVSDSGFSLRSPQRRSATAPLGGAVRPRCETPTRGSLARLVTGRQGMKDDACARPALKSLRLESAMPADLAQADRRLKRFSRGSARSSNA